MPWHEGEDWSENRKTLLKRYWDDGHSSSVIAKLINKETGSSFSRCAIIGKGRRMNLPARKERKYPDGDTLANTQPRHNHGGKRSATRRYPPIAAPDPFEFIPTFDDNNIPRSQLTTLLRLKNNSCRWPVDRDGKQFFCGSPTADITECRPYCAAHSKRAYQKSNHAPRPYKEFR